MPTSKEILNDFFKKGFFEDFEEVIVCEMMEKFAKQETFSFAEFIQYSYGWGNLAGKYYSYADTGIEYTTEELYRLYKDQSIQR